jgi:hypothetical protein
MLLALIARHHAGFINHPETSMGDHSCSIKIEFSIHNKTYKTEMLVNYWPDEDGVDERVKYFFRKSWNDASARYSDDAAAYFSERDEREIMAAERADLERLKAKYPEST